jgi:hypothetical protein
VVSTIYPGALLRHTRDPHEESQRRGQRSSLNHRPAHTKYGWPWGGQSGWQAYIIVASPCPAQVAPMRPAADGM